MKEKRIYKKFYIGYVILLVFIFQKVMPFDTHFSMNQSEAKLHISFQDDWEELLNTDKSVGRDVVAGENQSMYVAGNIFNSSKNVYDVLLSKYNSSGAMIWNVSWGGALNDYAYAVDINPTSSNIYVVGKTASLGINESDDIFILSYDPSRILQRNITWGGKYQDVAYDVKFLSNFIYIIGYSNSFSSSEDIIVLKFNSSLSLIWNKTYGTTETDIGYGIAVSNSNNIFITGKTTSSGNIDLILIELDNNGNQIWNTTWGGSSTDEGRSLIVNSFNEIFILANTRSFGLGSTDIALLKYNSSKELQWQRIWGGTDLDVGYKLVSDSRFNLFLIGYTESYDLTGKDACIIKYNSSGDYQWYKTRTDSSEDTAYSGYIDFYDNLYITGKTSNKLFLTKFTPLPSNFNLVDNATTPDSDGTFDFFWSESLDAVNYTVYQSNSSITSINSSIIKFVEGNTNRTIGFNNLEEGTYYFIVVAYNTYGNTTSNLINITVRYLPGDFLLSHNADIPDKDGNVNFTWSPSQGAESYEFYINNSLQKENLTDNRYTVNNLESGDYKVSVSAINNAGQKSSNEVVIYIRRSPTTFTLTTNAGDPDKDGMFDLIWTKSLYVQYYVIYNSSELISEINDSVSILYNFSPSLDLPTYRYNLSGLNNGTYYYEIVSFNQYGNYSSECIKIRVVIPPISPEYENKFSYLIPFEIILLPILLVLLGALILTYKKLKK